MIDVAVDAGADQVQRIQFGLTEETEREVREQAIDEAMSNADDDAAALANASDLEVSGVYEVSTAESRGGTYVTESYQAAPASTSVESGDVSVRVTVNVVYEAVPA